MFFFFSSRIVWTNGIIVGKIIECDLLLIRRLSELVGTTIVLAGRSVDVQRQNSSSVLPIPQSEELVTAQDVGQVSHLHRILDHDDGVLFDS